MDCMDRGSLLVHNVVHSAEPAFALRIADWERINNIPHIFHTGWIFCVDEI